MILVDWACIRMLVLAYVEYRPIQFVRTKFPLFIVCICKRLLCFRIQLAMERDSRSLG